jgi:transglutaminase-like putative cysteine protease
MNKPQSVKEVFEQVVDHNASIRENAIALHDYVREKVKFGFNKYFDASTPDYTLAYGLGHCIPKSRLMVALFNMLGLEAYQHFVAIPKDILKGAIPSSQYWMIGTRISHSFVDVNVEETWCEIDSFIVDTPLLKGGTAKLVSEGRTFGYGVRTGSVNTWDGMSNAFSQFDWDMMLEDHGRVDNPEAFFGNKKYRNVVLGMKFNTIFKLMGEFGVSPINTNIESIRQY